MCYLDLCIQLLFFPKDHVKSLSEQNFKKVNIKNIKMKPPVALFKQKSRKLRLHQKAKSQNLINTVVRCLHEVKDIPALVKSNVFIIFSLLFIYVLLEAVIEKCLLNICFFKLRKILEKYLEKYLVLIKLQAAGL